MKQSTAQIERILAHAKHRYREEGIELLGIFGSYAEGRADSYSDIDIAYRTNRTLFDRTFQGGFAKLLRLSEIKQELEKLLKRRIDLVSIDHGNQRFKEEIERNMICV